MKQLAKSITLIFLVLISFSAYGADWASIQKKAKGQTVLFNAWGGSETINDYIRWAAKEVESRYGVEVKHVKVGDIGDVSVEYLLKNQPGGILAEQ